MSTKRISVHAATTKAEVDGQCDIVQDGFDTIKAAKDYARRTLTDDYMRANEMTAPMGYACVMVNGVCAWDFFRAK